MRGGEYKCRVFKMYLKFRDQQLKTITYIYRLLYQNFKVAANQKSKIDIHTHTQKRNPNITLKIVITSEEENKRRKGKKDLRKQIQKQLTKWQ